MAIEDAGMLGMPPGSVNAFLAGNRGLTGPWYGSAVRRPFFAVSR